MNTDLKEARRAIARRVAHDIPEGAYVNLGVGLPTQVADYLPEDKDIFLHSENGVVGQWTDLPPDEADWDLINAGKIPIQLAAGGAFFNHAESFGMMRGGHIDICVLGAYQVSAEGDLANWHTGEANAIPAVGGAMDLAVGARQVIVMMEHLDRAGNSKILPRCTYPLTGQKCVTRIYTDMATLEVTADGLVVTELVGSTTEDEVRAKTAAPIHAFRLGGAT